MVTMTSLSANHALSVFKNSCCSAPVRKGPPNPGSRPKTAPTVASTSLPNLSDTNESRPQTAKGGGRARGDWSGPAVPKSNCNVKKSSPPTSTEAVEDVKDVKQPTDNYTTLFQTLLESNSLLHKEITRLRRDHKKAMSRLAHLGRDHSRQDRKVEECTQCLHTKRDSSLHDSHMHVKGSWVPESEVYVKKSQKEAIGSKKSMMYSTQRASDSEDECFEPSVMYDTPEEFHYDDSSDDDSDKVSVRSIESYQITYISSSSSSSPNESTCSSRYASPKMLVNRMWENFSVGDYPVEDFSDAFASGGRKGKQWAPKVTIPEPFSMTMREANTLKKRKTKSMIIAEKEQEEREALLDAKSRKQFHASPVPANTYLPLHDLINAKNAQRKELVRKMSGNMLRSSQKPFKFSKRDAERKRQKSEWLRQAREHEISQFKEKSFKAKPVPSKLFDPTVEEEAQERDEYRKIRSRIRAEELLAKSRAPCTVRQGAKRGEMVKLPPAQKNLREHHASRNSCTFQPRITHKIPDYKKAYEKLQHQLLLKKQSKLTTVSEPFNLHTEKRAKTRQPLEIINVHSDSGIEDRLEKVPLSLDDPPPYPPVMTETARRRQLLTQERMAEALLKDAVEEDEEKARKKRERDFQKIVARKSSAFDMTNFLEEKKKLKMEECRQKDRINQVKYKQHLENIKKRVEERPLLLEQVSSHSVDIARANYTSALKKVGFSNEEIEALLQDIDKT